MWNSFWFKAAGTIVAAMLLTGVILLISSFGSHAPNSGETASDSSRANPVLSQIDLEVPTIWCSTCKLRVEASAKSVPGVKDVVFDDQQIQIVGITYDPYQTTPQAIVEAIESRGDKVVKVTKLR